MQALEPITVADARAFLSLNLHDTDEDALLELLISGARSQAETYLRRRIAQQEVTVLVPSASDIVLNDSILFVKSVCWEGVDITTSCTLRAPSTVHTSARSSGGMEITYVSQEYCPPDLKNALLMMVRNSYTDRSSNPLTEDVKGILSPHRVMRV